MPRKKAGHRISGMESESQSGHEMPGEAMEGEGVASDMPSFGMGSTLPGNGSPRMGMPGGAGATSARPATAGAGAFAGEMPTGGMMGTAESEGETERVLVEMRLPRNLNSAAALSWGGPGAGPPLHRDTPENPV
jgi:hypothetical protein